LIPEALRLRERPPELLTESSPASRPSLKPGSGHSRDPMFQSRPSVAPTELDVSTRPEMLMGGRGDGETPAPLRRSSPTKSTWSTDEEPVVSDMLMCP
jgi:hypothetical protein